MTGMLRQTNLSSDIVTQDKLDSTVSAIVNGLSNVITPKLSTIADLVSKEVRTVDSISSSLSGYSKTGHRHSASEISSGLAPVATTGSYNDLTDRPDGISLSDYTPLSATQQLSSEVVEGLSNIVIPKLDTISTLVKGETERLDEISAKLSSYVSASDFSTLSDSLSDYTKISAHNMLESRVISVENQIGNTLSILQYINDTEQQ